MKTRDFGWSLPFLEEQPGLGPGRIDGWLVDYKKNRSNGGDEDSPKKGLPLDGYCSDWIKCPDKDSLPSPLADGSYKIGYTGSGYYRVCYHAGPGDKAWMEERDGNYLARLESEGQAAKAAELRASLPNSHPHYRAKATPAHKAAPPSPAPAPVSGASGGGAGAAAPAPTARPSPR